MWLYEDNELVSITTIELVKPWFVFRCAQASSVNAELLRAVPVNCEHVAVYLMLNRSIEGLQIQVKRFYLGVSNEALRCGL